LFAIRRFRTYGKAECRCGIERTSVWLSLLERLGAHATLVALNI